MKKFLLLMFRPDRYEELYCPILPDEKLVLTIANEHDTTVANVIFHAAKHAGVIFTMDEFYATDTLPWQIRNWLRKNAT